MTRKIEIRWAMFLLISLITAYGLFTGFNLRGTLDIQLHDTYFVIPNIFLFIILLLIVSTSYSLTFGLKRLSGLNMTLKIGSLILVGLTGLGLSGLLALILQGLKISQVSGQNMSDYGLISLIFGLAILFILRTIEIGRAS